MEQYQLFEPVYEGDYDELDENLEITDYNISVSPNDFNVLTIFHFIEAGVVKIPGFQRNYVWDIKRASKLIESLLIGVPIPQIFLYEEKKNSFLVIDGQQRLMTLYYFIKKRFPRMEKRVELRQIFDQNHKIPDAVISDNEYFTDFNLSLSESLPDSPNRLNKKNYDTLESDDCTAFQLKTIRNIIIKQDSSKNDDSIVFEVFNRLNTGGVNLKPQEIRTSLYHSKFYEMLYRINLNEHWRFLLNNSRPNINMKDIEILLRGFAMLCRHDLYHPSMTKFLNQFSNDAKAFNDDEIQFFEKLFVGFIDRLFALDNPSIFLTEGGRFNISIYESVFTALCDEAFQNRDLSLIHSVDITHILALKNNQEFLNASLQSTASTANVQVRISKAIMMLHE